MSNRDAEIIAGLDKPGAGIPPLALAFSRYIVGPFIAGRSDWDKNAEAFRASTRKILKTVEGLDEAQLTRRVLVPPQYALEDSSRYWSAAMVLEHLVIVGTGISGLVTALSNGIPPGREVDTAQVKPLGAAGGLETVASYRQFAEVVLDHIAKKAGNRNSRLTHAHPWFGPFTARQWFWLLQAHQFLHLKQLRNIVSELN